MLFLIHYNRSTGLLESISEFHDKDIARASSRKLELEISLLCGAGGQEVVLLEADSLEALQQTHKRYFKTLDEMQANTGAQK